MNFYTPIFADAINLPLVLLFGIGVLIPLLAFQVVVEGAILARFWRIPFRGLARCVFVANCWSLVAGLPVKIFNAWLYSWLLPADLAGFFAYYPYAVGLGTLIYFLVTCLVETGYVMKWLAREEHSVSRSRIWLGVLIANLATYVVLAPVHYWATRPIHDIQEFTTDTAWASQPVTQILYVDTATQHLKTIRSDGSKPETVVPLPVVDYQVSADLNLCLFRAPDGNLYLYRREAATAQRVWKTKTRYFMENVAFSPSGRFVAWFDPDTRVLEVTELQSAGHWSATLAKPETTTQIAWTTNDSQLVFSSRTQKIWLRITPDLGLEELASQPEALPSLAQVYGRVGGSHRFSGQNWGQAYSTDELDELKVWALPGLGASMRIYRANRPSAGLVKLAVNPGLLHLSRYDFTFTHPRFLAAGRECLFETSTDIYLLDLERKRIGRVVAGHSYSLLNPRYAKGQ